VLQVGSLSSAFNITRELAGARTISGEAPSTPGGTSGAFHAVSNALLLLRPYV
jgi:hypothetical protein